MFQYAHPEVLVDTQWLMNHLNDPTVRVVAVDTSPEPYKNARIPGAVFWNIFTDLLLPNLRINLDPTVMEKLLGRSGISHDTTVIAYGSYPGTGAWIFMMQPPEGTERGGHIPGAVHLEHTLTLNKDGTFKSAQELHALYTSHGITPDKEVFPYCAIGGRSAYTWFVLKYLLGYPHVRNYDGSWNEWSRLPNVPIEH
jgi:3-mercaptopyruvate sulfurtransferase SseA